MTSAMRWSSSRSRASWIHRTRKRGPLSRSYVRPWVCAEATAIDRPGIRRASAVTSRMTRFGGWLDAARQDLSYATRGLRRDPRFAAMVIATLSLGIGANAALFSLADRLFFRQPAGVVGPGELRRLYTRTNWTVGGVTEINDVFGFPQFDAVRSALADRVELAAYTPPDSFPVGDGDAATIARGVYATANLLPVIGARVALGRTFNAEEDRMGGGASVAVLSYRLWQNKF